MEGMSHFSSGRVRLRRFNRMTKQGRNECIRMQSLYGAVHINPLLLSGASRHHKEILLAYILVEKWNY